MSKSERSRRSRAAGASSTTRSKSARPFLHPGTRSGASRSAANVGLDRPDRLGVRRNRDGPAHGARLLAPPGVLRALHRRRSSHAADRPALRVPISWRWLVTELMPPLWAEAGPARRRSLPPRVVARHWAPFALQARRSTALFRAGRLSAAVRSKVTRTPWIVQTNVERESPTPSRLRAACAALGLPFHVVSVVRNASSLPELPRIEGPVVFHGRATLIGSPRAPTLGKWRLLRGSPLQSRRLCRRVR